MERRTARRILTNDDATARHADGRVRVPGLAMILGMLVSVGIAVFGLLVALGYVGHPIDAQLVSNYGWSVLVIGAALFVMFAFGWYMRGRRSRTAGRSA